MKGKLLYIHGTGDDNVHYSNAEQLLNALIAAGKVFQFMAYPNRGHGIYEGEGTRQHLVATYTEFLKRNCPPGGRKCRIFPKKVLKFWDRGKQMHTFASHSKKWDLAYVSTNQNQITVLRSQPGG